MFESRGTKVQLCVPIVDSAGEPFDIRIWTWWQDEIRRLMDVLPGSQGPWSFRTERFRWLTWVVVNSDQIEALREFAERARREFDLAQIYFDHHPVTFGIAGIAEHDSS